MWRKIEDFKEKGYYTLIEQKSRKKKKVYFHNATEMENFLKNMNGGR